MSLQSFRQKCCFVFLVLMLASIPNALAGTLTLSSVSNQLDDGVLEVTICLKAGSITAVNDYLQYDPSELQFIGLRGIQTEALDAADIELRTNATNVTAVNGLVTIVLNTRNWTISQYFEQEQPLFTLCFLPLNKVSSTQLFLSNNYGDRISAANRGTSPLTSQMLGGVLEWQFDSEGGVTLLPKNLTHLQASAFEGASFIRIVRFQDDKLQSIASRAFAGCSGLVRIDLPASVTDIAPDAFEGCSQLVIYCPAGSVAEQFALSHGIPYQLTRGE